MFGTLKSHLREFLGCGKSMSGKILGHLIPMSGKILRREIPITRKKKVYSCPMLGFGILFPIWEIHKENTTKTPKQPTLFTSWELQNIPCGRPSLKHFVRLEMTRNYWGPRFVEMTVWIYKTNDLDWIVPFGNKSLTPKNQILFYLWLGARIYEELIHTRKNDCDLHLQGYHSNSNYRG